MKNGTLWILALMIALPCWAQEAPEYPVQPISFENVAIDDAFWSPRIQTNRQVTIPYALKKCEDTGRIDNFRVAGKIKEGTQFCSLFPFDDSDVFKILEGAAYSLSVYPDPELDVQVDEVIHAIAAAQEDDGYLYTARTIPAGKPVIWVDGPRWSNLRSGHELYNLGHMYEAAVAHYRATGKRTFLDVAVQSADLLLDTFGPGKSYGVPGHQEIEIGLVKLYRVTGNARYLDLAKFFLDQRGNDTHRELYGLYAQDHKPVIEQTEAVGHAVRALYLYSGMTDIAAITGDENYKKAVHALWDNVVSKKYYLTGGIGARHSGEAFGDNYELPNFTAYCETCAAIANVLWNHRMFLLEGNARYIDVLERTLYNGVLSGISMQGDTFFYPNPLAAGVGGNERSPWFDCSCCPSNLARFIPSVPGYIYAHREDSLYVNLFIGSKTTIPVQQTPVTVTQTTGYPWQGDVTLRIEPQQPMAFSLRVRIPGWAQNQPVPSDLYQYTDSKIFSVMLMVNGRREPYSMDSGYAVIQREWQPGDIVSMQLPMPVHRVNAHPAVKENQGRVALERGPLVYCVEWPDYEESVFNLLLPQSTAIKAHFRDDLLQGINVLTGTALAFRQDQNPKAIRQMKMPFQAIPYYAWAHRGRGEMSVWLARDPSVVQAKPAPTLASNSRISVSYMRDSGETLLSEMALNDQASQSGSDDPSVLRFNWWPHKGTEEWVQYDFPGEETVSLVKIFWFDDSGHGGCYLPETWTVQYKRGDDWVPVDPLNQYETTKDGFNYLCFRPVKTSALRLAVQLQKDVSAGILEWQVR